jgi:hypothetical protein
MKFFATLPPKQPTLERTLCPRSIPWVVILSWCGAEREETAENGGLAVALEAASREQDLQHAEQGKIAILLAS